MNRTGSKTLIGNSSHAVALSEWPSGEGRRRRPTYRFGFFTPHDPMKQTVTRCTSYARLQDVRPEVNGIYLRLPGDPHPIPLESVQSLQTMKLSSGLRIKSPCFPGRSALKSSIQTRTPQRVAEAIPFLWSI